MITSYPEALAFARESTDRRVLVERNGSQAVVRMHDPSRLNPLSLDLTVQLHDTLRKLTSDPKLRCIVLTGSDPAFCAGGDFNLMHQILHPMVDRGASGGTSAWQWIKGQFGVIARLITRTDTTFIAAVNGAAAGVGLAFALACDLIFASDRARFVPAFGEIGLVPESGASWLLTRKLGYQRAFELFTGGRHLSGAEAADLGLVNAVVPHDEVMPVALEWCERIERLPVHVPAMTKSMLRAADMSWEQAITMEELAMPICFTTKSHHDAVSAWLSERPADPPTRRPRRMHSNQRCGWPKHIDMPVVSPSWMDEAEGVAVPSVTVEMREPLPTSWGSPASAASRLATRMYGPGC